jgi:hypothetical protein
LRALPSLSPPRLRSLRLWGACGPPDHGVDDDGGSAPTSAKSTSGNGFQTDGASICGAEVHQAQGKYPLIYFVIDRSGSMAEIDPGSGATRLARVQEAARDMVDGLGSLVRVGAAVYPQVNTSDECQAGEQVFAPRSAGAAFADAINVTPWWHTDRRDARASRPVWRTRRVPRPSSSP